MSQQVIWAVLLSIFAIVTIATLNVLDFYSYMVGEEPTFTHRLYQGLYAKIQWNKLSKADITAVVIDEGNAGPLEVYFCLAVLDENGLQNVPQRASYLGYIKTFEYTRRITAKSLNELPKGSYYWFYNRNGLFARGYTSGDHPIKINIFAPHLTKEPTIKEVELSQPEQMKTLITIEGTNEGTKFKKATLLSGRKLSHEEEAFLSSQPASKLHWVNHDYWLNKDQQFIPVAENVALKFSRSELCLATTLFPDFRAIYSLDQKAEGPLDTELMLIVEKPDGKYFSRFFVWLVYWRQSPSHFAMTEFENGKLD